MRKLWIAGFALLMLNIFSVAHAHFGMVIPSDTMVMMTDNRNISLQLSFSHPFEGVGMDLAKPSFWVISPENRTDMTASLQQAAVMGKKAWQGSYRLQKPGSYWFVMEPKPYWEPAEDCFIIHYTKVMVAAFGDDEGWDRKLGLKTEIVPLTKPFGLYAGNVFQGVVELDGKAVPFAEVEVEFYNQSGKVKAPTDYMVTQTVKADGSGVFTYATPASGWWGFAALNEADYRLDHNGAQKSVELGAVLWVKFQEWQQ